MAECKMKIVNIYKNGEYNVVSSCDYLKNKYKEKPVKYVLLDYAKNVFGDNFLGDYPNKWNFKKVPAIVSFLARMSAMGIETFDNHTIVYGKIYNVHKGFGLGELMLLSEIELPISIKELNKLVKENKIKIS